MADAYLTSSDVLNFNRVDLDVLISDVLDSTPFLQRAAARTVASDNFKYTKLLTNPVVGYRAVNDGIENTKATYSQESLDLKYLDASFAVDIAAAKVDERGQDHIMGIEARNHLRAAMRVVENNVFQVGLGTLGGGDGFNGFANQTNLDALAADITDPNDPHLQVVDAGGTVADAGKGSSVYAVKFGATDAELLWGEGGQISVSPRMMIERAGSVSGRFWAWAHEISAYCGLKIGSIHSVHRLANITTETGATLSDIKLAELFSRCPIEHKPDVFVMNRRSEEQLRASRQATNVTGAPAPYVTEAFGVPVIVTDAITSSETLLS
jgi:hypothetical protein